MINFFKRVAILLLLVVFLLPATGIIVYVHHCNMSNYTLLDVESSSSCCGSKKAEGCYFPSKNDSRNEVAISSLPCCEQSNMLVKLKSDILIHSLQLMQADAAVLPLITNINIQFSEEVSSSSRILDSMDYPPGELHYIMFSSFRL